MFKDANLAEKVTNLAEKKKKKKIERHGVQGVNFFKIWTLIVLNHLFICCIATTCEPVLSCLGFRLKVGANFQFTILEEKDNFEDVEEISLLTKTYYFKRKDLGTPLVF